MKEKIVIETILDLLKRGHSVELSASGYSMFPVLRPGDRVVVDPIKEIDMIKPGIIIIAYRENTLIMHRLIEVRKERSGESVFLMQGDCMKSPDSPVPANQLVGIAVSYFRNKKQRIISRQTRTKGKFIKNRVSMWLYSKLMQILSYFSTT